MSDSTFEDWWSISGFAGHAGSEAYVKAVAKRAWDELEVKLSEERDEWYKDYKVIWGKNAELQAKVRELEEMLGKARRPLPPFDPDLMEIERTDGKP